MGGTDGTGPATDVELFEARVERWHDDLDGPLTRVYGPGTTDVVLERCAGAWADRDPGLRAVDLRCDLDPGWFLGEDRVGYSTYVDRFGGDLAGVVERLDHLVDLGVTHLHLLPVLRPRPGASDGGYSVMDYRSIDPNLGTMADLEALAAACRERGITLCIDLPLNHTAREHEWARAARAGDAEKRAYYRVVEDRREVDGWESTLPEVFPEQAPGNFTFDRDLDAWVWTTFHDHQWDLDWSNPAVFVEMLDVVLHLANRGVGAVRLDAVAFMWKRSGTDCQNQPEVHDILQALRAATRIACPSLLHKAEAIVAPADVVAYLGTGAHTGRVSNLAYHNTLMVQFWSALATGDAVLARHTLTRWFSTTPRGATWVTYLRCHDDIGWAITPEDAGGVGTDAWLHRRYLADFYEGSFPGSWSRGGVFGVNEETGDRRTVGATASLCGLDAALERDDETAVALAIDRILLGHALIASYGGMPVLWMGDEVALRNDASYLEDPDRAHDERWLHRPSMDWDAVARRRVAGTVEQRVFDGLRSILRARAGVPAFRGDEPSLVVEAPDDAVLAVRRRSATGDVLVLCNVTDRPADVPRRWAAEHGVARFVDLLGGDAVATDDSDVVLPPYACLWLA